MHFVLVCRCRLTNHIMPDNAEAAQAYHDATKHSFASVRANAHSLDFANQPLAFKIYATLEPIRLPAEVRQTGVAALSAISEIVPPQTNAAPDLEAVAQLLYLSAGTTAPCSLTFWPSQLHWVFRRRWFAALWMQP